MIQQLLMKDSKANWIFYNDNLIKDYSISRIYKKSLLSTKSIIRQLTNQPHNFNQTIKLLTQQNERLHLKLKQQYQNICKMNALYLLQCQLRIQQKKSYQERINQFQNSMAELRKYLHDKQDSFTFVVEKLKKYQDVGSQILGKKLQNYSMIFMQDTIKHVLTQLSQEKEKYKNMYNQLQTRNQQLQLLVKNNKLKKTSQQTLQLNNNQEQFNMGQRKNQTNISTNFTIPNNKKSIQPNIQLIRLMKKQKLSNQILQQALNEAIQKNIELIQCNKRLIYNNQQIRYEMDEVIADMIFICHQLVKYDQNYNIKLRLLKQRSKCDIDMPSYKQITKKYLQNDLKQAEMIVFNRMRNDVNQMGEYIAFCPISKTNNIKSFECPQKITQYYNKNEQDSLNQEQFSIDQI